MPGTAENPVPLGPDADSLVQSLVTAARGIGNGLVAHMGISFGGNFAAMTGLTGMVDAAIDLGGPVDAAFRPENLRKLPYGMADIVGNAMGFDHPVTVDELSAAARSLDRDRAAGSGGRTRRCWWSTGPTITSCRRRTPGSSRAAPGSPSS